MFFASMYVRMQAYEFITYKYYKLYMYIINLSSNLQATYMSTFYYNERT